MSNPRTPLAMARALEATIRNHVPEEADIEAAILDKGFWIEVAERIDPLVLDYLQMSTSFTRYAHKFHWSR